MRGCQGQKTLDEFHGTMPWLALPFSDTELNVMATVDALSVGVTLAAAATSHVLFELPTCHCSTHSLKAVTGFQRLVLRLWADHAPELELLDLKVKRTLPPDSSHLTNPTRNQTSTHSTQHRDRASLAAGSPRAGHVTAAAEGEHWQAEQNQRESKDPPPCHRR